MPLLVEQLDLFDERMRRERFAEGRDATGDAARVLPPQSAASSAIVIADLLAELEHLALLLDVAVASTPRGGLDDDPLGALEAVRDVRAQCSALRAHWPGLRYDYDD
jgi:hypothetical protein